MIDRQDLEDRIASLERQTRNIGIGQELVVGSLHCLGDITAAGVAGKPMRIYQDTKANIEALGLGAADEGCIAYAHDLNKIGRFGGEQWGWDAVFNVKAWGAVGDNIVNDQPRIQAAIDSAYNNAEAGVVYFPPLGDGADDRYRIESSLDWKGGVCFLGSGYYSRISAHVSDGAFPIIQSVAGADAMAQGNWMKGLTLGFEEFYDDVNAKCVSFINGAPSRYTIEDVTLRNGYYGYYDETSGFLAHLRRVYAPYNRVGFYKSGGGNAHHFDTCWAQGREDDTWDMRGFDIRGGVGYVLEACCIDDYYSPTDGIAHFFQTHALTINGLVLEDCEAVTNGNSIVRFDENYSTFVSGMLDTACRINAAAADNTRLIQIINNRIHFSGCQIGSGTTCNAAGGGAEGYAIDIYGAGGGDMSKVSVTASAVVDPVVGTNAPTVFSFRLASALGTAQVTLDNVHYGAIYNPNANAIGVARPDYIHIQDGKSDGTAGGTFTSGAWRTRDLIDLVSDDGGHAGISSNQITLAAGTYRVRASCPAFGVNSHQARLWNITDGALVLGGTTEYCASYDYTSMTRSIIMGRFTLAAQKVLEVQHRCSVTTTTTGFGYPCSFGDTERYTKVELWKEL